MEDKPNNIAYHEAGHIVACFALGLNAEGASIVGDKLHAGIVYQRDPVYPACFSCQRDTRTCRQARKKAKAQVVMAYAGRCAEALLGSFVPTTGTTSDNQSAFRISAAYGLGAKGFSAKEAVPRIRYLSRLYRETQRLIEQHRGIVYAIAQRLMERKNLFPGEMQALRQKYFPKVPLLQIKCRPKRSPQGENAPTECPRSIS